MRTCSVRCWGGLQCRHPVKQADHWAVCLTAELPMAADTMPAPPAPADSPRLQISHGNTARHALEHGDETLAKICGAISADEARHEMGYSKVRFRSPALMCFGSRSSCSPCQSYTPALLSMSVIATCLALVVRPWLPSPQLGVAVEGAETEERALAVCRLWTSCL